MKSRQIHALGCSWLREKLVSVSRVAGWDVKEVVYIAFVVMIARCRFSTKLRKTLNLSFILKYSAS